MSEYQVLTVLAAFAFFYSLLASRLEKTPVNGPVIYLFVGLAFGSYGLQLVELNINGEGIRRLAEFTLALVLFSDSANADLAVLKRIERIPTRLLLIGLPLTIVAGFGTGYLIFDELTIFELALLATMLAPTDAALGQAVVTNKAVPDSVRASLNVESGLNDGICVPVLLFFLACASGSVDGAPLSLIIRLTLEAIGIGTVVGVALAMVGSFSLQRAYAANWLSGAWVQIPVVAMAMCCFGLSQWLGGSGFISSFVGGLVFGRLTQKHQVKAEVLNGAEGAGSVMSMLTWFAFGAVVFGQALQQISWQTILYAILSLTIVRILPVLLCLSGVAMRWDTKLFVGWFGPRGLASIVFIVLVIGQELPGATRLTDVVTWTVALSIVAHGLSALPFTKLYVKRLAARNNVL
ncbi:MAG: cation:proton antiporter [Pirellulaceae bacterium]|nr:cation:proton antiporter [Pirellulaceae bacterium]